MVASECNIASTASTVEVPAEYKGRAGGGLPYITSNGEKPIPLWTEVL